MKTIPVWAVAALIFILCTSLSVNGVLLGSERLSVIQRLDKALENDRIQFHILLEFSRLMCYDHPSRVDEARSLYKRLQEIENGHLRKKQ